MKQTAAFILISVASFLLAFFIIPLFVGETLFLIFGYPTILTACLLFLGFLYLSTREDCPLASLPHSFWRTKLDWGIIGAFTVWILHAEPFGYRILLDEIYLHGNALMMHLDRLPASPRGAHTYDGFFQLTDAFVDKRPVLFPFLLATIHDLTGYRPQNGYILNALLTAGLNSLVYFQWGRGSRLYGTLALGLICTLPLWITNANGGHFEILNLFALMVTWVLARRFFEKPECYRLMAFLFALLLLVQTRYENALYLIPFGAVLLYHAIRYRQWSLSWYALVLPPLLIPYVLQFRISTTVKKFYWQDGPFPGREETFSLGYIGENMNDMLSYLFSTGQDMTNSLILSILAFAAIVTLLLEFRKLPGWKPTPQILASLGLGGGIALIVSLLLVFNFGLFTPYVTARLSLPLHLGFAGLILLACRRNPKNLLLSATLITALQTLLFMWSAEQDIFWRLGWYFPIATLSLLGILIWYKDKPQVLPTLLTSIVLLWAFVITRPVTAQHVYYQDYSPHTWIESQKQFMDSLNRKDVLIISRDSIYPALLGFPCTTIYNVWKSPNTIERHLESRNYHEIYVLQILTRKSENEDFQVSPDNRFPPSIETETVWEKSVVPQVLVRSSRIVSSQPEKDS